MKKYRVVKETYFGEEQPSISYIIEEKRSLFFLVLVD